MTVSIASNTIVLDNVGDNESNIMNNSKIAWDNALTRAISVTCSSDALSSPNLFDYMTTTFWSAGSGIQTVDIVLPTAEAINCAAIAAGNWFTAGAVIEVYSDAGITKVGEISGLRDGQPYIFDFTSVSTSVLQFKFTSSGALNVGQLLVGKSLDLPTRASVGLQLGKFNNNDKVIGQLTETNAISSSSTVNRARDTIAPFQFVPIVWVESDWVGFSDSHKGKPIWFSWDNTNKPGDATFGNWSTDTIRYTSSFFTTFTLTVKGQV